MNTTMINTKDVILALKRVKKEKVALGSHTLRGSDSVCCVLKEFPERAYPAGRRGGTVCSGNSRLPQRQDYRLGG